MQGSMIVKEYYIKLTQQSKYAQTMVANYRVHITKFVSDVSKMAVKESRTMILIRNMDI